MYVHIQLKKAEAMNLKDNREKYMGGSEGRKKGNDVIKL